MMKIFFSIAVLSALFLVLPVNADNSGEVIRLKPGMWTRVVYPSTIVCEKPLGQGCRITTSPFYCDNNIPWVIVYASGNAVAKQCYSTQLQALEAFRIYKETGQCE